MVVDRRDEDRLRELGARGAGQRRRLRMRDCREEHRRMALFELLSTASVLLSRPATLGQRMSACAYVSADVDVSNAIHLSAGVDVSNAITLSATSGLPDACALPTAAKDPTVLRRRMDTVVRQLLPNKRRTQSAFLGC